MEAEDDVLHLQAPEEVLQEESGEPDDVGAVPDAGLLPAIAGWVGDILHPESIDVQPDEDIITVPIAGVDGIKRDRLECPAGDGGVAVLGIDHLPVPGGDLGEEGEEGVAEEAPLAHPTPELAVDEPVAHAVVGLPVYYRIEEMGEEGGVHLVVPGHHGGDIDLFFILTSLKDGLIAGDDCSTDPLVLLVMDDGDPFGGILLCKCPGLLKGCIL